jgi:hypothetical protein
VTNIFSSLDLELPPGVRLGVRSIFDVGAPGGLDATMFLILVGVQSSSVRTAARRLGKKSTAAMVKFKILENNMEL